MECLRPLPRCSRCAAAPEKAETVQGYCAGRERRREGMQTLKEKERRGSGGVERRVIRVIWVPRRSMSVALAERRDRRDLCRCVSIAVALLHSFSISSGEGSVMKYQQLERG